MVTQILQFLRRMTYWRNSSLWAGDTNWWQANDDMMLLVTWPDSWKTCIMRPNGNYHFCDHGSETMTLAFVEFWMILKNFQKFWFRNHNLVWENLWHSNCIPLKSHHFYHRSTVSLPLGLNLMRNYSGNNLLIGSKSDSVLRWGNLKWLHTMDPFLTQV